MKRWTSISLYKRLFAGLLLLLPLLFTSPVSAHSGGTDADGGHVDSSTGLYHYHHGYPAHQHKNGTCPYAFNNKTSQSSGASGSASSELARYKKLAADYQEENESLKSALSDAAKEYDAQSHQLRGRMTAIILLSAAVILLFPACCYCGKKARDLQSSLYDARRQAESDADKARQQAAASQAAIDRLRKQLAESEASIESLQQQIDQKVTGMAELQERAEISEARAAQCDKFIRLFGANAEAFFSRPDADAKLRRMSIEYLTMVYDASASYLEHKPHPAAAEAKRIRELKEGTRLWINRALAAEYRLAQLSDHHEK